MTRHNPPLPEPAPPFTADTAPAPAFGIGAVVRHRHFPFRGVVFDVDPRYANTEEWWEAIPQAIRPSKDQPFYHLLAENAEGGYIAYVSQQKLLPDAEAGPVGHPAVEQLFDAFDGEGYRLKGLLRN
jgi:heat shock protein HspQ